MEDITLKDYVKGRFDTQDVTLAAIQTRVDKTNGRVMKLELWRATLVGAWVVLTAIIIPIIVEILHK